MWAMASLLLCSKLRPIIQRRVEVIFHQETKEAVPPNHAIPLCISNDGLRRQIDEDGRVEAVYRHFTLNRVLWAAERLFSLEKALYKPQRCFRNLYSSNFHQTAWLWRIVTARKSPGFDRMDEWNWELFRRVFIPRLWLRRCHRSSAQQNRPGTWPRGVCADDAVLLPAEF